MKQRTIALGLLSCIFAFDLSGSCGAEVSAQTVPNHPNVSTASPNEISVTADAVYATSADFVQIIASFEATAQTAREAESAVEAKVTQFQTGLKQSGIPAEVRDKNRGLQASASSSGFWKVGVSVLAKRSLAIETSKVADASTLADLALQKGADRIESIRYSVRNSSGASLIALKTATLKAREKAEAVAASLGLGIGSLLSLTETVEPGAEIIRQRLELGESPGQFSDEELHVIVTARFEIKPK